MHSIWKALWQALGLNKLDIKQIVTQIYNYDIYYYEGKK